MSLIQRTTEKIRKLDESYSKMAQERLDILTKPQGSLGRLEEFARRYVTITQDPMPELPKKVIMTFAGDHGIAKSGVSAFPQEVTPQMVMNFLAGGAGVNVLARQAGADVVVVDIGVDYDFGDTENLLHRKVVRGTANIAEGPAMTREEAIRCIETGIELASEYRNKGYNLFGTGEMGIGNTTPSSAIVAAVSGISAEAVTGRGTGIDDEALEIKIALIKKAIEINSPNISDGIDVLAKLGGAEIGGIAGLCLGAAAEGVPVVVDGFISTAGALIAYLIAPDCVDYMFSAHRSVEIGQMKMLEIMGLRPVLDLEMRLGEGTGAALTMMLIESGLSIYREMATFADAGVSDKEEKTEISASGNTVSDSTSR